MSADEDVDDVREVFRRAADIIETRGLAYGKFWNCVTGQVCTAQALWLAVAGDEANEVVPGSYVARLTHRQNTEAFDRYNRVRQWFLKLSDAPSVAVWSDAQSAESAVRALRELAR